MPKIELSLKIDGRDSTTEEQQFIKLWLKFLELVLETGYTCEFINNLRETVENMKIVKTKGVKL